MSFKTIPCIYAGDLPNDVENELQDFNDELCFHGDHGCVFRIWEHQLEKVPLFLAWMIEIGAFTAEQINLVDGYSNYLTIAMTGT